MGDIDWGRRLAISPHFSAHVIDDRRLLLLSEQRSFRLSGRLYIALVPHLDGAHTATDIARAFSGRVTEERLEAALGNMLSKGYARYVDAAAPIARQALWAEFDLQPDEAERKLALSSLALKALNASDCLDRAARLLDQAARGNGLAVVPEQAADVTVVLVDDYLHRDLEALNRKMRRCRRTWLLFKPGGRVPLLGPLFAPQAHACWYCLSRRMLENRPGDGLVNVASVRPARGFSDASLGLATGFAAIEIARSIAGDGLRGFERLVISLDLASLERRGHEVRYDPACPCCGEPRDAQEALERLRRPIELQSQPILPQPDGGWRTYAAEEVVARLQRYVSPITGIVAGLEDVSMADGMPVFRAAQVSSEQTSPRRNRLIGRASGAAGKGMTTMQAKASCMAEAIERYLCGFTGREPRLRAQWQSFGSAAPHPNDYLNFSERQYDGRDEWNKTNRGFNWIPQRFDAGRDIEWSPGWSLSHREQRWLPSRFCYFAYADSEADRQPVENAFCVADSNGCASGSSIEEAILQGFLELVERDACALWWYNRVRRPAFDLEQTDNPLVRRTRARCEAANRGLHVLDVTNDLGIPTAIAVSYSKVDGKGMVFGLGAHLNSQIAVSRSIAELNQISGLEANLMQGIEATTDDDTRSIADWMRNKSLEGEPYCSPEGTVGLDRYKTPEVRDLKEAVQHVVELVAARKLDFIVVDQTRPEIDFSAARVVVPGLRHFWARFRAGRLYQAPVELGWLKAPLAEGDLNPVAFFL